MFRCFFLYETEPGSLLYVAQHRSLFSSSSKAWTNQASFFKSSYSIIEVLQVPKQCESYFSYFSALKKRKKKKEKEGAGEGMESKRKTEKQTWTKMKTILCADRKNLNDLRLP